MGDTVDYDIEQDEDMWSDHLKGYTQYHPPITEEFKNFWLRMEGLFGCPIHPSEIHRIKERMDELEKKIEND